VESKELDELTRHEVRRSSLRNAGLWKVDPDLVVGQVDGTIEQASHCKVLRSRSLCF
jgi:hypothetical protein